MPPAIPDRWIPYKACGKVIEGTRIICFKVPLRKHVQKDIKETWDIKTLLETIPQLGAVIDLTNTSRYYDPKELQAAGIIFKKILMPGRVIPPEKKVQIFMDTVDELLGKDCEFVIGVHCTHGLNRTGYMVCRYMRDRLQIPAEDAIKRFEKARGYKIERENYIADLLGTTPPPADLGKRTKLKPVKDKDTKSLQYRSPLQEYPDDDSDRRKYKPYKRRTRNEGGPSERHKDDKLNYNWRTGRRDSTTTKKAKERTDSESSFDYRFDY